MSHEDHNHGHHNHHQIRPEARCETAGSARVVHNPLHPLLLTHLAVLPHSQAHAAACRSRRFWLGLG